MCPEEVVITHRGSPHSLPGCVARLRTDAPQVIQTAPIYKYMECFQFSAITVLQSIVHLFV